MFESSVVTAELQGELARLRSDGRDRSLGQLVELVGACQSVVNQATALQTLAMAHVAAIEDVALEDGTVVEQHRGLGHQRLDAPALVSDQLGVGDAVAGSRLSTAVDVVTRVPGVFAAMGAGRLDEFRARVVCEELREAPVEVCAQVVARIAGFLGSEPPAVLRRRVRRVLAAVDPDLVRARAARARSQRSLRRWPGDEPGVDTWMGSFPAETSRSGWAVIDGLAREYVLDGRASGVEQARADALMDLIHARATGTFVVQLAVPADQLTAPTPPDQRVAEGGPVPDTVPGDSAVAPQGEDEAFVTVTGLGMPGTTEVRQSWLETLGDPTDANADTATDGVSGVGPTVRHEVGGLRPRDRRPDARCDRPAGPRRAGS